mmetsp:Transcript_76394/g.210992  ORF Transcript_76394/g.210992 Transcript_76394/m.210992 type:complete len:273 (+) Transcript_76394:48-866(+)|eukprot:CAMPEP_0179122764 /NCGR_PEP_ID=MMETSP0796-20121207/57951_1 /TAXON_ID=73915 /ORGANISM="Pyrodinium bahamense, Strain pbaha01" /LENGTH=272 /DNA_ID=CAMNT_0020821391 /DNA_START=34 /DNA_END=852 /DNA_ORIENTATION=-
MGATCSAPGAAAASGATVISVVRSGAWGLGADEDVWQVEVPSTATLAELKVKIEELYDVPQDLQKLAAGDDPSAPGLEDTVQVSTLERQKLWLHPNGPSEEEQEAMTAAILGAAQESMEISQAVEESLQGVTYQVNFERPSDAGGQAAGKKVTLTLEALALVGDVQQMVEVELFGAAGTEPAFLVFEGAPLPGHSTLYHAGIEDGKTVMVAKERPPTDEEQLLALMAAASEGEVAAPDQGGGEATAAVGGGGGGTAAAAASGGGGGAADTAP